MPIVDFTDPVMVVLALMLFVAVVFLGKHLKKSIIPGILLAVFLAIIIIYCIQYLTVPIGETEVLPIIIQSAMVDLAFIFITFISYLWIDDVETKAKSKKSIDNSMDWLWKNV